MNIINFCLSSDSKCTLKTNPCFRELLKQKYISDNFYNKFNKSFFVTFPQQTQYETQNQLQITANRVDVTTQRWLFSKNSMSWGLLISMKFMVYGYGRSKQLFALEVYSKVIKKSQNSLSWRLSCVWKLCSCRFTSEIYKALRLETLSKNAK